MLFHYLKIAARNFKNHTTISLINIAGLAIGLVATLLVVLYVANEYSYDRFHKNGRQIVKVGYNHKDGDQAYSISWMSYDFGRAVKESCPEVKDFARITDVTFYSRLVQSDAVHKDYETNFVSADNGFLRLFSFEFVKGDPGTALTRPNTVLLTERMAAKYFGTSDPMGKTITYNKNYNYEVVGILKDPPSNSSLQFDFLADLGSYRAGEISEIKGRVHDPKELKSQIEDVGANGPYHTYFLLNDNATAAHLAKKIPALLTRNSAIADKNTDHYDLYPLFDLHFLVFDKSAKQIVNIISIVGILILSLALINYINLTTARSTTRAGEVSIRKIVGAARKALVFQFYMESVVFVSAAFVFALVLVFAVQSYFSQALNLKIDTSFLKNPWFILPALAIYVVSIFLSGSYPAMVLSRFAPIEMLKGRFGIMGGAANLRKLFTVFQFTVSIALIISSFLIVKQIALFHKKELGINRDQVITVFLDWEDGIDKHYKEIRSEMETIAGVASVTATDLLMYYPYGNVWELKRLGSDKKIDINAFRVDEKFVQTMDIKWAVPPQNGMAGNPQNKLVLNETAARQLGIRRSEIGLTLDLGQNNKRELAGIIKDFHFTSLSEKIKPMMLLLGNDTTFHSYLYVKLAKNADVQQTLSAVQRVYDKYKVSRSFEYSFLDDTYNQLYKSQEKTGQIIYVFTGFAMVIACLGLFGLTVFTADQRRKEIGIRKVLGATVLNILSLLSRDYIILVLISVVIASPVAYYGMSNWLEDFAYRISISWWVFILAGCLATVVALVTVSFQGIRAATVNPVKSLKSE